MVCSYNNFHMDWCKGMSCLCFPLKVGRSAMACFCLLRVGYDMEVICVCNMEVVCVYDTEAILLYFF